MKKFLACLLALTLIFALCACAGQTQNDSQNQTNEDPSDATDSNVSNSPDGKAHAVGITVQDLANVTWAQQIEAMTDECATMGWTVTAVQNDGDAAKTITQIENFVNAGCDFIFIQSFTGQAIADAIEAAQAAGVCVIGTGTTLEQADINYVNDNYEAGYLGGVALGEWVNETFGEDHNIAIGQFWLDLDMPGATDRSDGQIDGLTETHPNFELVAMDSTPADASTAMTATENMMAAHPEIQAICNWGDSMALGTLEVIRSKGIDESQFAIISVDGTKEACEEIAAGSALIMSCSLGGPVEQGLAQVDIMRAYLEGTNEDLYYSPNEAVTKANVEEYMASLS